MLDTAPACIESTELHSKFKLVRVNKPKDQLAAVLKGTPVLCMKLLVFIFISGAKEEKLWSHIPGLAARKAQSACTCGQRLL